MKSLRPFLAADILEDRTLLSNSIPLSTQTWTAVGPAGIGGTGGFGGTGGDSSGRIAGVAADPTDANVLFIAAAGGGVWKSTDAGVTWTPKTDDQTTFMGAIAVAPSNGQVIYAGEGEANNSGDSFYGHGILKSTDGGNTWVLTGNNVFDRKTVARIAISATDPNTAFAAVSSFAVNGINGNTGIWKTTDGGATWNNTTTSISTTEQYSDVVVDPADDQIAYAAVGTLFGSTTNGVYKTTDGGNTWAIAGNFPISSLNGRISIAIAASSPNTLVASVADAGSGTLKYLEKTTDGGTTWTTVSAPDYMAAGQGWYDNTIAISPTDPNAIFAGGVVDYAAGAINGVIESLDGGSNWTDITRDSNGIEPHTDSHATGFDADGHLLIGNDGGIWRLDNDSTANFSWSNINGNLQITQFTGVATDPTNENIIYGGSQDNGTEKFNDNLSWTQVFGGDGGFVAVDPSNTQIIYTENFGVSLVRSNDGGQNFTSVINGINTSDPTNFYVPYVIDPSTPSHLLYGTNRVYATTDRGDDWTPISTPNSAGWNSSAPINTIAISPTDPNTIYASTSDDKIFVTTDGGTTWNERDPANPGAFLSIAIDPTDPMTAYTIRAEFTGGVGHVYKTTNGGQNWTDISGNLPDVPTNTVAIDASGGVSLLYVGTDTGVFESSDGGTSWSNYKTGLPVAQVVSLEVNSNLGIITAGTHGRGVFQILTVGVLHIVPSTLPTITETKPFTNVQVATFTDSEGVLPVGTYSATINWGDGTAPSVATITTVSPGVFGIVGGHTYALPGTYSLTISAIGTDLSTGTLKTPLVVSAAPLTTNPHDFTIGEGLTYTGSVGTFTSPNPAAALSRFTASIDWGDGSAPDAATIVALGNGTFEVDGSHQYIDFGTFTFVVTITDSLAGTTTFMGTATVTAAAIDSTGTTFNVVEGSSDDDIVATITSEDVNPVASDFTASINWGDGTPPTTTSNGATITDVGGRFTVSANHTYARFGTYNVTVMIESKGGSKTTAHSVATVTDAPLTSTPISATINQGDTFTGVVARITDSNPDGLASDLSATINWGDGTLTVAGTIGTILANNFSVSGIHTYTEPGVYSVIVSVKSVGGQTTTTTSTITVNDAPDFATGTQIDGIAGVDFTATVATFTDAYALAKLSDFTATIDWGDGTALDTKAVITQPGGVGTTFVVTGSHGYIFPDTYVVNVTILQLNVQVATAVSSAVMAPSNVVVTGLPLNPITIDQSFSGAVATFTSPNLLAPSSFYLATIDWGDGTADTGVVTQTNSGGDFTVSSAAPHAYAATGTYTIKVTILVLSGSQASGTTSLEVDDAPFTAGSAQTLNESAGTTFSALIGTFTQYAKAPISNFTTSIDWGDGSAPDVGSVTQLSDGSFAVTGTHAYRFNGVYDIHVDLTSAGGSTGSLDAVAIVQDVPLAVLASSIVPIVGQVFTGTVATFSTPNLLATSDEFTATVNWGDGTSTQNAEVSGGVGSYVVLASHTYANASSGYSLTVVVTHHSQRPANVLTPSTSSGSVGSARVIQPISGALVRSSDSGSSNTDGITNITTPVFTGSGNPGATAILFISASGTTATEAASATIDSTGHWTIQIGPLGDGSYTFFVEMFDGVTDTLVDTSPIFITASNGPLVIDTVSPTVANVVLSPNGVLQVIFNDNVGMNPAAVASASNYTFSQIVGYGTRPLAAFGVSLSGAPTDLTATLAYQLGRGVRGRGTTGYVIEINANGISDLAGNTLVEKNFVTFPQTTNSPNPDYVAEIDVRGGVASAPKPYVSLPEQIAASRYAANVHSNVVVRVPQIYFRLHHPRGRQFRRHR